jgi:hypothetical protein
MSTAAVSICRTRVRLRRARSLALSAYARAAKLLRERSSVVSKQDYERILHYAEKTQQLAEQVRADLDKHLLEHGCYAVDTRP